MGVQRLFGTDGIRGKVSNQEYDNFDSLNNLYHKRTINPLVMATIGYSVGNILAKRNFHRSNNQSNDEYVPSVVIGWDRRPSNLSLVNGLSVGLKQSGCKICWVGEIPTPGLQYCVLHSGFDAGFMITASHNPHTDSGVKLFDENGYKSMPEIEDIISKLAWETSKQNVFSLNEITECMPDEKIDGIELYKTALLARLEDIEEVIGGVVSEYSLKYKKSNKFLIDSSGGASTSWLKDLLKSLNINALEVSTRDNPINQSCGAGDFSPTSSWRWEEIIGEQEHFLLRKVGEIIQSNNGISPWSVGEIIGAALDGDGDRCLLFEVTDYGLKIINGDQITDEILRAAHTTFPNNQWKIACTIEADMGLVESVKRFSPEYEILETAVGDRWLSNSLRTNLKMNKFLEGENQPTCIGCEDSGHIVLPIRHPNQKNHWSLVGDGIMTLLSVLSARVVINNNEKKTLSKYNKGWKKRVSVKDADRNKWNGKNDLANIVINTTKEFLNCEHNLEIENIYGENNLLLMKVKLNKDLISIGIRNSGTEAKTSISIRANPNVDSANLQKLELLTEKLSNLLKIHLCN